MADMEKVMTALELCSKSCDDDGCIYLAEACDKGSLSVCRCVDLLTRDAIELLKAQEGIISVLKSDLKETLEVVAERSNVVRCKDCQWRGTKACFCKAPNDVKDDWFCSEGERKET